MSVMEGPVDELVRRILGACASDARERAARIVAQATREAEEDVKSLVKSGMKAALLREVAGELGHPNAVVDAPHAPEEAEEEPGDAPWAPQPVSASDARQGWYVYGLARLADGPAVGLRGVTDAPLETLSHDGVAAVVNQVPLDAFENALKGGAAENLGWLESKARSHDGVLKAMLTTGPVIPFRFCTILRSDGDVREMLSTHRDAIARTLDEFEGKEEWGVKIVFDASGCGRAAPDGMTVAESGGKAYLLNKKRRREERGEAGRVARARALECHQQLAALAADAETLPTRRAKELGEPVELLLNGAYLVAKTSLDRFRTLVGVLSDRHRDSGLALQMTGPWPAYNFVRLDLSMEAAA